MKDNKDGRVEAEAIAEVKPVVANENAVEESSEADPPAINEETSDNAENLLVEEEAQDEPREIKVGFSSNEQKKKKEKSEINARITNTHNISAEDP